MLLICFGTRPEWIKIKPLLKLLDKTHYKLLFTGQHPDLLKNLQVDYRVHIGESVDRLNQTISDCLTQFPKDEFDMVLVQGDTASAYACALAAFNRKIRICHLESGLRSYNLENPYPEEAYRQMISRITNIHFAPTSLSESHLKNEKVKGDIYITGNTALDNLRELKDSCEYGNKVLVTLHRRENHTNIQEWFNNISLTALRNPNLEFIFPIHPNPNVQSYKHLLKKVNVVEPMEHDELLKILVKCKLVITDSGGIQEEATFFNKKIIVCRKTTERPEAIDTGHLYLCEIPKMLTTLFHYLNGEYKINTPCPYGDGYAAEKIIKILYENI